MTDQPQDAAADASAREKRPEVQAAEEALRMAREQLEKAQKYYESVRQQVAAEVEQIKDKKVGDVLDSTLDLVRKNPASGLLVAAAAGFLLGRLFRK